MKQNPFFIVKTLGVTLAAVLLANPAWADIDCPTEYTFSDDAPHSFNPGEIVSAQKIMDNYECVYEKVKELDDNPPGGAFVLTETNAYYLDGDPGEGNVGIGTDNPHYQLQIGHDIWNNLGSNFALAVQGDIVAGFPTDPDTELRLIEGVGGNYFRVRKTSNTTVLEDADAKITMINTGNVGIGTTSPDSNSRLDVDGILNISNGNVVAWGGGSSRPSIGGDKTNNSVYLSTSGSERMRISASGNVGIRSTDPGNGLPFNPGLSGLHINSSAGDRSLILEGDSRPTMLFHNSSAGANDKTFEFYEDTNGKLYIRSLNDDGSLRNELLTLQSNGQIGIGKTDPQAGLHITGPTAADQGTLIVDGNGARITLNSLSGTSFFGSTVGSSVHFTTDNQTRMTMLNTGLIGIGTTGPTEELHIVGTLLVDGPTSSCTLGEAVGSVNCTSDERLKENIRILENPLEKVLALRGVSFNWKDKTKNQSQKIGVIAQDVEKVFPALVSTVNDYKAVDYGALVAPLIEAIKEQQQQIEQQQMAMVQQKQLYERKIDQLAALLKKTSEQMATLTQEVEAVKASAKAKTKPEGPQTASLSY